MNNRGYERFILLIDGIQKSIKKIKLEVAPSLGIKSVHVFWLRHIAECPDGITAAELAAANGVDRSLISREIEDLERRGYVKLYTDGRRYVITEEGRAAAEAVSQHATEVQKAVNKGIDESELESFYATLETLSNNFKELIDAQSRGRKKSAKD